MPCAPCHSDTRCKVDGGVVCRAFVSPHEILDRLLAVAGPPSRDDDLGELLPGDERALTARRMLPLAAGASTHERYAHEYAAAQQTVALLKRLVRFGRVLVVDCGSGALVRRLCEQGFLAVGVSLDGDAARARRLSGIRVEIRLPIEERFDVIIAET